VQEQSPAKQFSGAVSFMGVVTAREISGNITLGRYFSALTGQMWRAVLIPFAEQHYCCGYYGRAALVRKAGAGAAFATDALQRIAPTVTAREDFQRKIGGLMVLCDGAHGVWNADVARADTHRRVCNTAVDRAITIAAYRLKGAGVIPCAA
jgi:hypothetical protein